MSKEALVLFTPYIGDTFVASALCRVIMNKVYKGDAIADLLVKDSSMATFAHHFGVDTMVCPEGRRLLELGESIGDQLRTKYTNREGFRYHYEPTDELFLEVATLSEGLLNRLDSKTTIFNFHYSYAHAAFARAAKERGFEVYGYILDDNHLLYTRCVGTYATAMYPAEIWDATSIGEHLARSVLGQPLSRRDFFVDILPATPTSRVTLFPTTRNTEAAQTVPWSLLTKRLKERNEEVFTAWFDKEIFEDWDAINNSTCYTYYDLQGLVHSITESKFIVCHDSAAFHLAWYYNVPAIVHLKKGFNWEWIPEWVRNDKHYQFIEAGAYYPEEYLHKFIQSHDRLWIH